MISFSPDTTIDLKGFDTFQAYLLIRGLNANVPKYLYPR